MKILFSDRTLDFKPIVDDDDRAYLPEVDQLLSGKYVCKKCGTQNDTHAWATIRMWMGMGREAILEGGKQSIGSLVKREKADIILAMFKGFETAVSLVLQVVSSWKQEQETVRNKKKERQVYNDINGES